MCKSWPSKGRGMFLHCDGKEGQMVADLAFGVRKVYLNAHSAIFMNKYSL